MAEHGNKIQRSSVTKICEQLNEHHYERIKEFCGEPTPPNIEVDNKHASCEYPKEAETRQQKMEYGHFLHYLVYKFVYNLQEKPAHTIVASNVADALILGEDYNINELKKDPELVQEMIDAYSEFTNLNNDPRNILPEIFVVSTFHQIRDGIMPKLEYNDNFIDNIPMEAIFNYIQNLIGNENAVVSKRGDVEASKRCFCLYFCGDANLVVGDTIVDLRFSAQNDFYLRDFTKLIFYSIGFYLSDRREITKFIIYNMKTGNEYKLCLPNLQFPGAVDFCRRYIEIRF